MNSSILARKKNLIQKDDHQSGPFPLIQKYLFGRALRKGRGGRVTNQNKTKQETVEKPLTGSAVNGMHFSIQVTHPSRTSKTGLESLPYSHRLRLLLATGAVLNSNTLCLCRTQKHQHKLIKQKGVSLLTWLFIFLSHTFKHLSLVQFSKSVV